MVGGRATAELIRRAREDDNVKALVAATMERFGKIDVLLNCAGLGREGERKAATVLFRALSAALDACDAGRYGGAADRPEVLALASRAMELSMPTVKMHLRNIFRVLGVPNRDRHEGH